MNLSQLLLLIVSLVLTLAQQQRCDKDDNCLPEYTCMDGVCRVDFCENYLDCSHEEYQCVNNICTRRRMAMRPRAYNKWLPNGRSFFFGI